MRQAILAPVLMAIVVLAGCGSSETLVGHHLGSIRGFVLPEIGPHVTVGQRFRAPDGTMRAIDIRTSRVGTPRGTVHIELRSIAADELPPMRVADVPAADFVRGGTYPFSFEPLNVTDGTCCVIEVSSSPSAPASGAALWATQEPSDSDDTLIFNGKPRWGNLALEAHVAPIPQPPFGPKVWIAFGVLALAWVAIIWLVRQLAQLSASDTTAAQASSSR